MEDVSTRASLVREHQVRRLRLKSPDEFVEVRLPRPDRPDKHRRIGRLALGVRDSDRIFVDVETDKKRSRLCHS